MILVVDAGNNMQVSQCRPLLTSCRRAKHYASTMSVCRSIPIILKIIYKNHSKVNALYYSTTSCLCLPINASNFNRRIGRPREGNKYMESPLSDEEANSLVDFDKYHRELEKLMIQVKNDHAHQRNTLPRPPTDSDVTLYNVSKLLDVVNTEDGKFKLSELTCVNQFKKKFIKIHLNNAQYMDELVKVLVESKMSIEMKDCFHDGQDLIIPSLS